MQMKKIISLFIFLLSINADAQNAADGWSLFSSVMFKTRFHEELNDFYLFPEFTDAIKSQQGALVTIKGHYLAFKLPENRIIVSKYPYASCFFCGGAGPESVVEVHLKEKKPTFKVDALISVKGKLKLNESNIDHSNFIITDAEIIKPF
jgi:hypothetical protein